jgi:hypothetical protein
MPWAGQQPNLEAGYYLRPALLIAGGVNARPACPMCEPHRRRIIGARAGLEAESVDSSQCGLQVRLRFQSAGDQSGSRCR